MEKLTCSCNLLLDSCFLLNWKRFSNKELTEWTTLKGHLKSINYQAKARNLLMIAILITFIFWWRVSSDCIIKLILHCIVIFSSGQMNIGKFWMTNSGGNFLLDFWIRSNVFLYTCINISNIIVIYHWNIVHMNLISTGTISCWESNMEIWLIKW